MNKVRAYNNHYKIDGVDYDRLTSVLNYFVSRELHEWALKLGKVESENVKNTAMGIGSYVDGKITQFLKDGIPIDVKDERVEIRNCVEGFNSWYAIEKPKVINTQITGKCDWLMVAGTYDILTDKVLIDVKCANKISKVYWIQTAMYIYMNDLPVERMGILRLDKMMGDYEYVEKPYDKGYVLLFVGLLNYYNYIKKPKKEVKKNVRNEVAREEVGDKYGF